ncbi:MAG: hypothetical protein MJA27_00290 [Pseudanabaenales cyanobacterium]|nr:hypothetical protein [Pseudanabaenales cyanobacterium]
MEHQLLELTKRQLVTPVVSINWRLGRNGCQHTLFEEYSSAIARSCRVITSLLATRQELNLHFTAGNPCRRLT